MVTILLIAVPAALAGWALCFFTHLRLERARVPEPRKPTPRLLPPPSGSAIAPPGASTLPAASNLIEGAIAQYGFAGVVFGAASLWKHADPHEAHAIGPAHSELTTCDCGPAAECPWCAGSGYLTWHVAWVKSEEITRKADDEALLKEADYCTECRAPVRRFEDSGGTRGVMSIAEARVRGLQARVGELEEALSRIDNLLKMPERQHVFGMTLSELIRRRIAEVVARYRLRTSGQALLRLQRLQDQVMSTRASAEQMMGEVSCWQCGQESLGSTVVICESCATEFSRLHLEASPEAHRHAWTVTVDGYGIECICGESRSVRLGPGTTCGVCGSTGFHLARCWAWKEYSKLRFPNMDPGCQQNMERFGIHLTPCRCRASTLAVKQEDSHEHGDDTVPE